jgi:hypothetical protein
MDSARPRPKPPAAGKGRPKGALNKATREIKDFARALLESDSYRESLRRRVESGRAPHMETLLHYYGYGKPKETVDTPAIADLAATLASKVVFEVHPGPSKVA